MREATGADAALILNGSFYDGNLARIFKGDIRLPSRFVLKSVGSKDYLTTYEITGANLKVLMDGSRYHSEPVWADKLKINKIALNLLSNAIKFTPAGGTVTVTPYCVSADPGGSGCGFTIEDTGMDNKLKKHRSLYIPYAGPVLLEFPLLNKGSAFSMMPKPYSKGCVKVQA